MVGEPIRKNQEGFWEAKNRLLAPSANEITEDKYPENAAASDYKTAADRFGSGLHDRFYRVALMLLLFDKHYGLPIMYCHSMLEIQYGETVYNG